VQQVAVGKPSMLRAAIPRGVRRVQAAGLSRCISVGQARFNRIRFGDPIQII
jgi:hypothetical protein